MVRRIRGWRPSHTTVAAYMALFVALGGTSYAAVKLPKNSVGSKQLKKNAVTSKKVKRNAITGSKVKNGALTKGDFKAGELPELKGDKGDPGDNGDRGLPGENGTADAFARVQVNGTLQPDVAGFPSQNKGTFLISKG